MDSVSDPDLNCILKVIFICYKFLHKCTMFYDGVGYTNVIKNHCEVLELEYFFTGSLITA